MQNHDRFADAVLRDEMRKMNNHLPRNRKTLEELLTDPSPSVISVSGHKIRMRKEELQELQGFMTSEGARRVRLPIVFLRRRDLGPGVFTVLGDPYEEYVILLLTGSAEMTFDEFKAQNRGTFTIYKPQVSLLVQRFHSLIIVGFGAKGLD